MSAVAWWYDDPADLDLDYDLGPCPTLWADEAIVIGTGVISWSAAASLFDDE